MKLLNLLFFAIPEREYEFVRYRNQMESTPFLKFSQNNWKVKFLKLKEAGYAAKNPNPDEIFFDGKNKFFFIPFSMYRFVRKAKPEVVFIHSFIFPIQVILLKFFISSTTKLIIQHHAEKPFTNPIKRFFQKLAYQNADAYLFSSLELAAPFLEEEIIKDRKKVYEVMEGSSAFILKDKLETRKKLGITGRNVFLWVGRLNENKDPLTVLEAFKQHKINGNEFLLYMIYGTSEMESIVSEFIIKNDLQKNIHLIGRIEHSKLQDWFNAADYFVAASHYEGSGIALCEGMGCGCIPIVSRIPSFVSMTDNGECGYLFETGNSNDLTKVLNTLNEIKREELSKKVFSKFRADLSFEAIGDRIYKITNDLLKSKN